MLSSDTTKEAASTRKDLGGLDRGEKLARSIELAFRGNYQLLHMPDVALGLMTLRGDDESLSTEDRARLSREASGTIYAEVINGKARWDMAGRRAAYFFDPAMFRFRATDARGLTGERSLDDRIMDFIRREPGCSWNQLRTCVEGGNDRIKKTLKALVDDGRVDDRGDKIEKRLHIPENPRRTRTGQGQDNLRTTGEGRGVSGGALP